MIKQEKTGALKKSVSCCLLKQTKNTNEPKYQSKNLSLSCLLIFSYMFWTIYFEQNHDNELVNVIKISLSDSFLSCLDHLSILVKLLIAITNRKT